MHTHLSGVAFHVHCVGLGCHVVIGVGRLVVRFHHAYVIPSFLHVVVRLCLVIVNSNCSHNYCLLQIAKTGHLRCCIYRKKYQADPGCISVKTTGFNGSLYTRTCGLDSTRILKNCASLCQTSEHKLTPKTFPNKHFYICSSKKKRLTASTAHAKNRNSGSARSKYSIVT